MARRTGGGSVPPQAAVAGIAIGAARAALSWVAASACVEPEHAPVASTPTAASTYVGAAWHSLSTDQIGSDCPAASHDGPNLNTHPP